MSGASRITLASRVLYFSIVIPASGGTAATLWSLISSQMPNNESQACIIGGRIDYPSAAYTAGSSASSLPISVSTDHILEEPAANFITNTYVKAAANATITVGLSVWLTRDNGN